MNRAWRGSITVRSAVLAAFIASVACVAMLLGATNANASFNVTDFTMTPTTPASTTSAYQAGGHPTVNFRINPDANLADSSNGDDLKKVTYEFPAGSLGDPKSITTKCSATQFAADQCPAGSYIGSLSVQQRIKPLFSYTTITSPGSMYVLSPPTPGSALTVGFIIRPPGYKIITLKTEVTGVVSVRSGLDGDYGLTIVVDNIPRVIQTTLGVNVNQTIQDISIVLNSKSNTSKSGPYFTYAPTRCDAAKVRATMLSYAGVSIEKKTQFTMTGCSSVPFTPTASVTPSTTAANTPANWTANFSVPTAVAAIQQSHIKSISVDLPPSTQLNYAELANLTVTCSEAQINADQCPDTSKIGTVSAQVPLLEGTAPNFVGDVYLLSKTSGVTFGYIVRGPNGIKAQIRGYVLPVDSNSDGIPDFIRATSDNMPQAPFSPANITFNRPLVINPVNCGTQTIKTTITGWSGASWTGTNTMNVSPCGPTTPDTTITSTLNSPTKNNTPTFTFTANPTTNATFEVSMDGGAYTSVGTTGSYTTAALTDGSHTFRVRACNSGATPACDASPAEKIFVVDTVAPSLNITSPTEGQLINMTLVGVNFNSSDSSATFRCKLDGNADAACTSGVTYSGLAQGAHSVQVTATDPATNSTTKTVNFTVDSQAPTIVTTCAANNPSPGSATCSWTINEPVTNVTCQLDGGSQDPCTSPKVYTGLTNATHTVTVRATDAAGNSGTGVSNSFVINVDTTPPVTTINSGPTGLVNSRTATFTFSANETATFYCSMDGAAATACVSGVQYTNLTDAPHTFSVYAVDTSGNTESPAKTRSFTVDATAPSAPGLTGDRSGLTNQTTATLTASGLEAGAQLQVSSNGGSTWTNATSPISLTGLTDGAKSYTVRQVDAAGNASTASNAVTWTVDATAPAAPTLTRTAPTSSPTSSTSATLTAGNLEAGAQLQFSSNGGSSWTNSTNPVQLTGLGDGAKSYTVRQVDAAGNASAASSAVTWTVDTLAPTAPTVTRTNPTVDPTSSTTQAISIGNVEAGGTLTCVLDSAAYTPCTTSISLSSLGNGPHTFSATVTDAAGNISAPGSVTWTVDNSPVAAPTISSGPAAGSFSQSLTATFAFSSTTSGVTYECRVDGTTANYAACTSPFTTATLSQASHTFYVRAKNGVGTYSAETSRQWTVDATAPAAPTLTRTAPATTPTKTTTATLTAGNLESGAQLQYSSNGGSTWTNSANPVSLSGLTEGSYSYTVRQVDQAGNASAASSAVTWVVDTTAPGAPTVTRTNPTADPTASQTQDISVTTAEAGGTLTCTLDSAAYTPCAAGTITLTGLSSATHTFSVFQTDAAGNAGSASSVTWTVNAVVPNAPTISSGPAAGSNSNTNTATFAFSSTTSGVTYECRVDGTTANYAACTSPFTTAALADGSHTFYVRAKNGVGTTSAETSRQWNIDTVAPATPTLSSNRSGFTNQTTATLTAGNLEVGAQLQVSSNGGSTWSNTTSPISLTGLTNGSYSYIVRQVDAANNASASSNTVSWTVDTTPPAAPTVVRTNPTADPTSSATQDISVTPAEAGGTLTCTLDSVAYTPCAPGTITLTGLSSQSHTFSVTQTDAAGNTGSAAAVTWTVNTGGVNAPTISSGPAAGSFVNTSNNSFAFSSTTSGVTYECHMDAAAYAACTSPFATGSLADGSHTFYVRAKNNVGTLSPETSRQYTIDTVAPANPGITLVSPTTSPTQSKSASISFTGEAGATFYGSLNSAAAAVVTSPVALSNLADGSYTYAVYQRDAAGNQSGTVSVAWVVDTTAPAAPTLTRTAPASTPTTSKSATLTAASVEAGAQLQVTSNGGTTWANTANPVSLSNLADGTYTYAVRAVDAAGNASASSNSVSWTVDTTGPVAPNVTGPSGTTALQTATITFTDAESPVTFQCSLDGGASPTFSTCTSPQNLSGLANGPHTFDVRALDALGNAGPATRISWTVDTTAFTASIVSGPSGTIATNSASFTYTATITSGTTFECNNVSGTTAGTTFTTCANAGVTYSSLTDGSYTFAVRAKNGAQTTPATSRTYTVDTTAPTVNATNPGTTGASGSISFTVTDPTSPVTVTCQLDGGSFASCASPYAFSGLISGSHTLNIRAVDAVGNTGTTPVVWTVDATPPDTTISGTPTSPTSSKSASLTLTSTETPATFQCNVDGAGYTSCTSPLALSNLADGLHTVSARATDQYGNQDASPASVSWTVDTTAPAAPTLVRTAPATTPTNTTTATLTASGVEAGAQLQYSSNGGSTWTNSANPVSLTGLTNGSYSYTVRAVDAAGNASAASNAVTWTVDTTPPATPTLTRTAPATTPTNSTSATLTAGNVEAGGTLQYSSNGGSTWTNAASNPIALSGLADGSYSYTVRVLDAAGNASAASTAVTWTVDTAAPAAPTLTRTAPASSPTNSTSATLTAGGLEAGAQLQYSSNGGSTWTNSANPVSLSGLTDGSYSYTVRQVDAAGNASAASSAVTWTVDTVAPSAPTLTRTSPTSTPTNQTTATLTAGSLEAGAQLQVSSNGGSTWSNTANPVSLTGLTAGSYSYTVRQVDAAGNASAASAAVTWTVDLTAPGAPTVTRTNPTANPTASTTQDISITPAETGGTLSCTLDSVAYTPCISGTITLTGLTGTTHSFAVRQTDAAGNQGSATTVTWTVDNSSVAAPTISSGPAEGSFSQSLTATFAFSSTTSGVTYECRVDGTTANYAACTSPFTTATLSQAQHTFFVRAKNGVGTLSAETSRTWTVDATAPAAPTLTRTSPTSTPTNQTTATLTAGNLEAGAQLQVSSNGGSTWTNTANPVSLSSLTAGSYSYTVRQVDQAGNASAASSAVTWTVDLTAPAAPTLTRTAPASSPTNSTSATLTAGNLEAGAQLQYSSNGGSTWTNSANPVSLTGLAEGSYSYTVRQIDTAGNAGPASTAVTWTVDLTAPATPTLTRTSPTSTPTNQTTATLTAGGLEAGAQLQYSSNGGSTWTNSANPVSLTGLTNGSYSYTVRQVDAAGNASSASAAVTWTVDTTPPAAPGFTGNRTGSTNQTTATLTATGLEAGAQLQTSTNGGTTWTNASNPVALSGLADGTYTYIARQIDAAGNASPASSPAVTWTVDTAAPAAPTLSSNRSGLTNQTSATVTAGNLEAGAQLQCSTNGGSTFSNCTSPINLTGLADGIYGYYARQVDAAGNVSAISNGVSWQVDTVPPAAPTVSTPPNSSAVTATITFSGEAGATFECSLDNGTFAACTSPNTIGDNNPAGDTPLAVGTHTYGVRAKDAAGNTGSVTTVTWQVTSSVPLPNTLIGDAPATSPTLTPSIPVSTDTGTSYECSINDGAFSACTPSTGTFGTALNDVATNKIAIRAKNSAGVDASPAVTYVWVSTAPVSSNATVTASDSSAGAHPSTVSGTITLNGGYNAKTVAVDMPLGLNGALTATDQKCDASGGDPEAMNCAVSAPQSAIGTISGVGVASTVGTITDASSTVYLTTPPADGTSPAGVWVDVKSPSHPELGHIRAFGWVTIKQVDNGVINGETRQSITIPAVPERTSAGVRFHVNSVNLVLQGDPPGGTFPLITNPTTCDDHFFVGGGTTWAADGLGGDGPEVPQIQVPYPVTDCGSLEFTPELSQEFFMKEPRDGSTYDPDIPDTSVVSVGTDLDTNLTDWRDGVAGTVATVTNGAPSTTARKAAIKSLTVLQPQGTGAAFAALAGPGSTCPGSAASATGLFDQSQCSPAAQIGTASIDTPLLADPLVGTVWLINNTPLPWIGIYISPDQGNNPAGVYISLTATTDLTCAVTAPSCTDATYKRVTITSNNLPDVPMNSVTLDLSGRVARAHDNNGDPTPGLALAMPDAGSAGCLPNDSIFSTIVSGEAVQVDGTLATTMAHCTFGATAPTMTRTPSATPNNATSVTFNITNTAAGAGATLRCRLDRNAWYACNAGSNVVPITTEGSHTFSARAVNAAGTDASAITNSTWTSDFTAPTLTISMTGSGTSRSFPWSRNENGAASNGFVCSKDGAAFSAAACGTTVAAATRSGTLTWSGIAAGNHTFQVRITDPAGNQTTSQLFSFTV